MMIVMVLVFGHYHWEGGQAKVAVGYKIVFLYRGQVLQFDEHILQMGWRKNTNQKSVAVVVFLLEMYTFSLVFPVKHVDPSGLRIQQKPMAWELTT